uniref:GST N-terminal domain-containing protein n=1 Tax=Ananas comosus var. bracteatus TaxID=296719 RepID=A0A6V7PL08_ANACO|nr:unnamed protein product [Ananas comosus var. bracteatus]
MSPKKFLISGAHHAGSEGTGAAAEPRHSLPQHTTSTAAVKSAAVHLLFGLYILSTAVASDLSQAAADCFRPSTFNFATAEQEGKGGKTVVLAHSPQPPIVLVHGIFGFGKGRLGGLSYFAGAEKKDHRVLMPDLGSLTSIHDRARELFYYLKGGQVDYGEKHNSIYGNSRFGRIYEEGLDYEYKAVNLLKGEQSNPEFEKINPIKYVPALVDGDVVVADSFAIILIWQYLEDKYPQNPLLPQDLKKKALNLQITSVVSSGIQPFQNLLVLQYIKENLGSEKKLPWVQLHINKGFTALEKLLAGVAGKYATGDEVLLVRMSVPSPRAQALPPSFPATGQPSSPLLAAGQLFQLLGGQKLVAVTSSAFFVGSRATSLFIIRVFAQLEDHELLNRIFLRFIQILYLKEVKAHLLQVAGGNNPNDSSPNNQFSNASHELGGMRLCVDVGRIRLCILFYVLC